MVDFSIEQKVAYSIIRNSIQNNKISHAYLVNTNNYSFSWEFVMEMVKMFLCVDHLKEDNCLECDLCRRISDDNYPELKIIEADGMWIKKNQIIDLQTDFNKIALEGNKRVYVIKDAEKMNQTTSNSILKFLEEPSNEIIAILVTSNLNLLLPTIVSRCQLINLNNKTRNNNNSFENFAYLCVDSQLEFKSFVSDENNKELFNNIIDFIKFYENNDIDTLIYSKEIWHSKFKDRIEIVRVLDLIINFYYDMLLYKLNGNIIFFNDYINLIEILSKKNSIDDIIRKINASIESKDKIKYNVNLNLFFDKYIIMLGGNVYEGSGC